VILLQLIVTGLIYINLNNVRKKLVSEYKNSFDPTQIIPALLAEAKASFQTYLL